MKYYLIEGDFNDINNRQVYYPYYNICHLSKHYQAETERDAIMQGKAEGLVRVINLMEITKAAYDIYEKSVRDNKRWNSYLITN